MRTSARNQFSGKVTAIQRGAVNDEVEIGLPDGQGSSVAQMALINRAPMPGAQKSSP